MRENLMDLEWPIRKYLSDTKIYYLSLETEDNSEGETTVSPVFCDESSTVGHSLFELLPMIRWQTEIDV